MNSARMSNKKQWINIGKAAARRGFSIESVLTGNESVNILIRDGFVAKQKPRTVSAIVPNGIGSINIFEKGLDKI